MKYGLGGDALRRWDSVPPSAAHRAQALSDEISAIAARTDLEGTFPSRSVNALRKAGLLSAPVSVELGGEGLGQPPQTLQLLQALAAVGRGSLVVGRLYEAHVNALQLIAAHGSDEQKRRAAGDAVCGHLFAIWHSETDDDGLKFRREADGLRLSGRKTFAAGVGHVTRALVTASLSEAMQPSADAVPARQMILLATDRQRPRVDTSSWKPLGMRGGGSHAADFSGHSASETDLVGTPGDYFREPAVSAAIVRNAAVQQGGVEAVFDETRRYLAASGSHCDAFQQRRLGEMAWRVETGRLWLEGAARACSASPSPFDLGGAALQEQRLAHARMMHSALAANALQVLALADQTVGARGLQQPEPFERLHRDLTYCLRQSPLDSALVETGCYVLDDSRPAAALWQ